jgi:two-component system chemotaxis response regulator CheY
MATKILSVDDSATMRRMVGRTVAVLGYTLLEAANGLEALDVLARERDEVALVILDVNMPELDGETTLQRIKGDPALASIPVMMLTTESERARILRFIEEGASNYLMKPFTDQDLSSKIVACLGLGF